MTDPTDTPAAFDDSVDRVLIGAGDRAACRAAIRGGSKTFHAASLLLPARIREPALALYAFCRLADDAIDESRDPAAALADLHQRLDLAATGRPRAHPADRALAATLDAFDIPLEIPAALLDGFAWDSARRRYATLTDLEHYAMRVAGTVGLMMSLVMGARSPVALARAADLGIAMQLSNIARDVGEDARLGRLYLPLAWMREAGLDPDGWLAQPVFSAELATVIARVLEAAERLYSRSSAGIAELPVACRPGMHAARLLYAEIGREVQRRGLDAVSQRAVVPSTRKAALLPSLLIAAARAPVASDSEAALEAARFLVEAAARPAPGDPAAVGARGRRFEERVVWLLGLFERLERSDRRLHPGMAQSTQS